MKTFGSFGPKALEFLNDISKALVPEAKDRRAAPYKELVLRYEKLMFPQFSTEVMLCHNR